MQPHHLTIAAVGRNTLFPHRPELLRAVRTLARVGGDRLWLFALVDDHVHLVVHADRTDAGHLASGFSRALTHAGAPPLLPTHVRAVDGRNHLETLVGYLVKQPLKHGLVEPAAHWPGTCAPDLLGARVLPGFDPSGIARALPRYEVRRAVLTATRTVEGPAPAAPDWWTLAHAAAAAVPGETGPRGVLARIAWAHLAASSPAAARAQVPPRTFRWLFSRSPDPAVLAAASRAARLSVDATTTRAVRHGQEAPWPM